VQAALSSRLNDSFILRIGCQVLFMYADAKTSKHLHCLSGCLCTTQHYRILNEAFILSHLLAVDATLAVSLSDQVVFRTVGAQ
jgi:hypothetical protein